MDRLQHYSRQGEGGAVLGQYRGGGVNSRGNGTKYRIIELNQIKWSNQILDIAGAQILEKYFVTMLLSLIFFLQPVLKIDWHCMNGMQTLDIDSRQPPAQLTHES